MDLQNTAELSVNKMFDNDEFSKWLGIEIINIVPGKSKVKMKIRKEMLNGFNVCHGGIPFSLADSALAFASNSYGILSMSIENNISYFEKVFEGDEIFAEAEEISLSNKIAVYSILITKNELTKVAHFKGTVYRTREKILEE